MVSLLCVSRRGKGVAAGLVQLRNRKKMKMKSGNVG